jgi:RNA recognition motif-containing protein
MTGSYECYPGAVEQLCPCVFENRSEDYHLHHVTTSLFHVTINFFKHMNIYVGNLDYEVNESELEEIFTEYGTVESAKVIMDRHSGRSKGFGFVIMDNDEEANKAIKELNGSTLEDRTMVVNEARPKRDNFNR